MSNRITRQRGKNQDPDKQLKFAADLHGHFGPFLVLGVRMGLCGLRELGVKKGEKELHATVMLKYTTPVSCILDGIQVSTRCTVGNTRLTWKNSKNIGAIFQLTGSNKQVEVWVKPAVSRELKLKLDAQSSDEEIRGIGWQIESRSDAGLFIVKR